MIANGEHRTHADGQRAGMMKDAFDNYDDWRKRWLLLWRLASTNGQATWTTPWLDETWKDGNPIFSAWASTLKRGVRVLQHPEAESVDFWVDQFGEDDDSVRELVISCPVDAAVLAEVYELLTCWVCDGSIPVEMQPIYPGPKGPPPTQQGKVRCECGAKILNSMSTEFGVTRECLRGCPGADVNAEEEMEKNEERVVTCLKVELSKDVYEKLTFTAERAAARGLYMHAAGGMTENALVGAIKASLDAFQESYDSARAKGASEINHDKLLAQTVEQAEVLIAQLLLITCEVRDRAERRHRPRPPGGR